MKKILLLAVLSCAALMTACGGGPTVNGNISLGNSSQFDSLSYALGVDLATGLDRQMKSIPLDYKALEKGMKESALDSLAAKHSESTKILQEYFQNKVSDRAQKVQKKQMKQDSVRLAKGDSTKVEYPADPEMFENSKERKSVSYALGNDIGYSFVQSGMPIQIYWVEKAMNDVHRDKAKMDEEAAGKFLQYYFMVQRPAENGAAAKEWLDQIAQEAGVSRTPSGLLYKVTNPGNLDKIAKPTDEVRVQYTGRLKSGKVFDSSIFNNRPKEQQEQLRLQNPDNFDENGNLKEPDQPVPFPLNRVIAGWTEGLQLIGEGGVITLWIPSELAYGTQGIGRDIGPNEALQFDVELLEVIPTEETK